MHHRPDRVWHATSLLSARTAEKYHQSAFDSSVQSKTLRFGTRIEDESWVILQDLGGDLPGLF